MAEIGKITLQVDTREKPKEWARIKSQFDSIGVDYFRSKLWVGDYMNIDYPRVIVDRKKDLLELCGNVCQQHERFTKELMRAQDKGIKLIILCEHGPEITRLADVYWWHNPRRDEGEWIMKDGHPYKQLKSPNATEGINLYKSLLTIRDKYGVDIQFCNKEDTGYAITKILGG